MHSRRWVAVSVLNRLYDDHCCSAASSQAMNPERICTAAKPNCTERQLYRGWMAVPISTANGASCRRWQQFACLAALAGRGGFAGKPQLQDN